MALHKYNQLIVEMNAAMRLDRHPELNAGWTEFARDLINSRRDRPNGPKGEGTDSTHHDTGDGAVIEKDEVADLVQWARKYHIDVIPEIPALSHSYYLLTRHREIADMADAEWPDAYCPSGRR
ncbi:MAG: family 20 glycosylhydrolase [Opitutaceae bacterium]|nr:family 20 glycosylhydrolase [Opitutaceae bacterium]